MIINEKNEESVSLRRTGLRQRLDPCMLVQVYAAVRHEISSNPSADRFQGQNFLLPGFMF